MRDKIPRITKRISIKRRMRLLTLKSRILVISVTGLLSAAFIVTTFVVVRGLEQRQLAYETAIQNLVFSATQAIAEAETFDHQTFSTQIERLASAALLQNVSLVDDQRRIISHAGGTHTPPINPANFPENGNQLLERGQFAVYIEAINTVGYTGVPQKVWLLALADRTSLIAAKEKVIRTGIVIFLFASLISYFVSRYLTGQVLVYLRNFEKVLSDVHAGKKELELGNFKHKDLAVIEELLAEIGTQMYNYRTDITEEIEQTTQDLRETLETIEIQNVELDIARKNAIKANNAKSEFLANMSHEIRTPLNGIIGFGKILMRSPLNSQQADTLRAIQKSSEVLLVIINDILDFSKVEAGRIELEQEPMNFHELIEDIVVMLAASAHHKGLELNYLYYEDAPKYILGDSLRLKQVITNLINNAVKFTNQGEIVIRVMLDDSLDSKLGNLKVSISDTGIGLSATEQTSIFKAFSQADASTARQFGGTGLGLSICRGLVHEMGGEIDFESEPGNGATFWFTLPLDEELMAELMTEGNDGIAESGNSPLIQNQTLECLLFEPQQTSRRSIQHALSIAGVPIKSFDSIDSLADNTTHLSTPEQAIALLCLNEDDLDDPAISQAIDEIKAQKVKVLLFTQTLKSYDHATLTLSDGHALKPATTLGLSHSIANAMGFTLEPITGVKQDERKIHHPDKEFSDSLSKNAPALASLKSPHKVLAVDDNEMNLALVKALVTEMGLEIDLAESGEAALELCKKHFYPLILMDIQMPDMDGVACLKALRKLSQYKGSGNIVALTAYALPDEKNEFIEQGFIDLISKPLDEDRLYKIILNYLPETKLADNAEHLHTSAQTQIAFSETAQHTAKRATKHTTRHTTQHSTQHTMHQQADSQTEDAEDLPIFDWEESVHLCNGNAKLAGEFSEKLFLSLPESRNEIEQCRDTFRESEGKERLLSAVHKLHGVTLLCGIPKLRYFAHVSEHALKTEQDSATIHNTVNELLDAIDELIDCKDHILAAHAPTL